MLPAGSRRSTVVQHIGISIFWLKSAELARRFDLRVEVRPSLDSVTLRP